MKHTRTFMLGWEFPPFISGGLGTACYGLTKAMDKLGVPIVFVLPKMPPMYFSGHCPSFNPRPCYSKEAYRFENVAFRSIPSALRPYVRIAGQQASQVEAPINMTQSKNPGEKTTDVFSPARHAFDQTETNAENYGSNIHHQVYRYAEKASKIARNENFELVHAHDWMTFPAGMKVAQQSGKPLVVHVHSTEFDRSGEHVNQIVYDIERAGMHEADKVIAVSRYTRDILVNRYGVSLGKTEVVYNGVEHDRHPWDSLTETFPFKTGKIVLFLGRITMQKGPDYFLRAARRVLEKMDNVKFVMAGDGDLLYRSVELAAELQIGHKVFFTRFLRGDDIHKVYKMADLYVMPSVSEPFGIAPLEALQHGVPVLISKQSGIGEALFNALKVDFWDIDQMAHKIVAALKYPALNAMLGREGYKEIGKFNWEDSAGRIIDLYDEILHP